MLAVDSPKLAWVTLASAQAKVVPPEIAKTPGEACDLAASKESRLAALRLGFFAPDHDASGWLDGWYPATFKMQAESVGPHGTGLSEYWTAGTAPLFEVIPDHDPFKPHAAWPELREQFGERVSTVVIGDASHALFPEQPLAVADVVIPWMKTLLASS
jgi:hypothetical protein